MRIKEEDKEKSKRDILTFLIKSSPTPKNISEIARAVGKSAPTVKIYVEELRKTENLKIFDKQSMKIVVYSGVIK